MCFQNPSSTSSGTSDGQSSSVPTVIWPPQSSSARRFKASILFSGILSSGILFFRSFSLLCFAALRFTTLRFATLGFATVSSRRGRRHTSPSLPRAVPRRQKISANPTRGWASFLPGTIVEVQSSDPRASAQIRGKFLPLVFRADQCYPCKSAAGFVFLVFSVSPCLSGRFSQNKNGSPGTSCRSSDEGAPSERLGENHLLHVHVFRQAIELACRVPRLNDQNVGALGSGNRLVKGRAGRRAY